MAKSASCSKIREDTRAPERGSVACENDKAIRLPEFGQVAGESPRRRRSFSPNIFGAQTMKFMKKIFKKYGKNSRFRPFCPLILVTKGGAMVNNMVLSREIEWIGYEHKRNMLQVEFIVGAIYQYENVPETVYQEFLTAPSHGRFFESKIKNKYQTRKIR